jgi:hypothetical protein
MIKFILFISIITLIFIIYTEYSVGGILIRSNSLGKNVFNFKSLFHFMIHPLYNKFLWNFRTLDINYPFIILISIFINKFDFIINIFHNHGYFQRRTL